MLRYPFATFLVTFALFSFLALLIASGEVRFSLNEPEVHPFAIEKATVKCASDELTRPSSALLRAARSLCNDKPRCEVNTTALMQQARRTLNYECAQEITLTYRCLPPKADATASSPPLTATLYRGQTTTLPCFKAGA